MQVFFEISYVVGVSLLSILVLFTLTRLGGKRQIAQMSTFDYMNSITIGSIAAEMATNLEQWYRPLAALLVYGLAACAVHCATRKSLDARRFISGQASVLMENGTIYKDALTKAAIDIHEFLGQARVAGYFDLNELQSAVMETSGQISFLPKSRNRPVTPQDMDLHPAPAGTWNDLILDGAVQQDNLQKAGRDEHWLTAMLAREGIGQMSEVFYAACDEYGNFFACRGQ